MRPVLRSPSSHGEPPKEKENQARTMATLNQTETGKGCHGKGVRKKPATLAQGALFFRSWQNVHAREENAAGSKYGRNFGRGLLGIRNKLAKLVLFGNNDHGNKMPPARCRCEGRNWLEPLARVFAFHGEPAREGRLALRELRHFKPWPILALGASRQRFFSYK